MKIGVPVICQNGHKAVYYFNLEELDWKDIGVAKEENCDCPKWEFGQGWKRDNKRDIIIQR